ncbi:MAG TPA: hypothetical protein VFV06_02570 [Sphingorhabdus sp.]|nr:hypothetical protein [Sphingorhabdus sp.]
MVWRNRANLQSLFVHLAVVTSDKHQQFEVIAPSSHARPEKA